MLEGQSCLQGVSWDWLLLWGEDGSQDPIRLGHHCELEWSAGCASDGDSTVRGVRDPQYGAYHL